MDYGSGVVAIRAARLIAAARRPRCGRAEIESTLRAWCCFAARRRVCESLFILTASAGRMAAAHTRMQELSAHYQGEME
ncbi:hypothetical protein CNO08_08815 [Lysobacter capsici]|nr:hypothetical protein CNO08_08815 [Lysobacter capsici]